MSTLMKTRDGDAMKAKKRSRSDFVNRILVSFLFVFIAKQHRSRCSVYLMSTVIDYIIVIRVRGHASELNN